MRVLSGPAKREHAFSMGAYWASIREDTSWVRRRVTTVDILDVQRIRYKVSLDVDSDVIKKHALESGQEHFDFTPLPLVFVDKVPQQQSIDLTSASSSCRNMTADEVSFLAHSGFLNALAQASLLDDISDKLINQIYKIIRAKDGLSVMDSMANDVEKFEKGGKLPDWCEKSDITKWSYMLSHRKLSLELIKLATKKFLVALVSLTKGAEIVKYRRVVSSPFSGPLGVSSISIPMNGLGTAQREHVRVTAPDGVYFQDAKAFYEDCIGKFDAASWNKRSLKIRKVKIGKDECEEELSGLNYLLQRSSENRLKKGDGHFVRLRVSPILMGFYIPAFFAISFALIISLLGLFLEYSDARFSRDKQAADPSASVTLIGLVPTMFAVFISQNENKFTARAHRIPRLIFMLTVLPLLFCAWSIAVKSGHEIILTSFNISSFVAVSVLSIFSLAILSSFAKRIWFPLKRRFIDD